MQIHPGNRRMPKNVTHATLTVETHDPETKTTHVKRCAGVLKPLFLGYLIYTITNLQEIISFRF